MNECRNVLYLKVDGAICYFSLVIGLSFTNYRKYPQIIHSFSRLPTCVKLAEPRAARLRADAPLTPLDLPWFVLI